MGNNTVRVLVIGARGVPDVEGGAEKNAEKLFPLLASGGYNVTLMGLKPFIKSSSYKGVNLVPAPCYRFANTDKVAYYVYALIYALRKRPDIVHLQGLGSAILLFCYKAMGCKVVVRYGSADYIVAKWGNLGRLGFLFSEWQLRYADAVIAVTPALAKRLEAKGVTSNVHVIPNAIDEASAVYRSSAKHARSEDTDRPFILAVGRVTAQKNFTNLALAFKAFVARNPGYRLYIVGGLDDRSYVADLEAILDNEIELLGRLPRGQIMDLLQRTSLFVNVSHHEGSSNATLEAIGAGSPILLSDIPENRDLQLPDQFHVDPNDISSIAAGLERAVRDRVEYRPDLDRFMRWSDVARKTATVYGRVLGRLDSYGTGSPLTEIAE